MSRSISFVIIALAVVAITGGALLLAARSRDQQEPTGGVATPTDTAQPKPPPAAHIKGAKLEGRDPAGKLQWKVTAEGQLQFDKDREVVIGKQVHFVVVEHDQTPLAVTAAHFTADYPARRLVFEQGVSGRLIGGAGEFTVQRLEYQLDTRKFIGTQAVAFRKGEYEVTARTLVVDPVRRKVRLRGQVRFAKRG